MCGPTFDSRWNAFGLLRISAFLQPAGSRRLMRHFHAGAHPSGLRYGIWYGWRRFGTEQCAARPISFPLRPAVSVTAGPDIWSVPNNGTGAVRAPKLSNANRKQRVLFVLRSSDCLLSWMFLFVCLDALSSSFLLFDGSGNEQIPPGLIGSCWPRDQRTREWWQLIPHRLIIELISLEPPDWWAYPSFVCAPLNEIDALTESPSQSYL